MDALITCGSFSRTKPTSICLLSVIEVMEERGHSCRILSIDGLCYDTYGFRPAKNSDELKHKQAISRYRRIVDYLNLYLHGGGLKNELVDLLYEKTEIEIERRKPDVIVSSYGSIYALEVGSRIKKKYQDSIIYVPYFLDGLLSGPSLRFETQKQHDNRAIEKENRLLRNADSIVLMKSAEDTYKKYELRLNFTDKICYLDIPLYKPRSSAQNKERLHFPPNQTVIYYAGSMPRRIRDPRFFMEVFTQLSSPNTHLYIAGTSAYMKDLRAFARRDNRIHLLGLVPHDEAISMQVEADYLLNIGNSFQGMMPSKIFEYMSTGKPIVSTYKIKDDSVVTYLEYYGNSLLIDEKADAKQQAERLGAFIDRTGNETIVSTHCEAEKLYNNKPEAFVEHLEKLVNKKF